MDEESLKAKLLEVEQEHRDLDQAIRALSDGTSFDQLQVQRLKKRKLQLRDQIRWLESQLVPDIIA